MGGDSPSVGAGDENGGARHVSDCEGCLKNGAHLEEDIALIVWFWIYEVVRERPG